MPFLYYSDPYASSEFRLIEICDDNRGLHLINPSEIESIKLEEYHLESWIVWIRMSSGDKFDKYFQSKEEGIKYLEDKGLI